MPNQIVKVFALGGQAEKGKGMYGIEINQSIYVVEAGFKFPESENLGIDIIIADYQYLINNKKRVKAIFITHGHDDVMAALPYLLENLTVPVYAPTLAGDFIESMMDRYQKLNKRKFKYELKRVNRNSRIHIGKQAIQFFSLTHSFPGTVGIAFETKEGSVVFAGEFIIDPGAPDNFQFDLLKMSEIGKKGVLCLMAESQAADRLGYTSPQHKLTSKLEPIFENNGRIIITAYSQNIFRTKEIVDLAIRYNKRIVFYSKDENDHTQHILQISRHSRNPIISVPKANRATLKDIASKNVSDLVVLVTAAANRLFHDLIDIVDGGDEYIKIRETDQIVVASPVLPGTEILASHAQDELYRYSDNVTILKSKELWSMHAASEDLKMLLQVFKPKYYIPIKGDYRQMVMNGKIAESLGMKEQDIIIMDNGEMMTFEDDVLKKKREIIPSGSLIIDGMGGDVGNKVIDERVTLSEEGVIIIGVSIDRTTKKIVAGPDIQMRGLVYLKDNSYITDEMTRMTNELIEQVDINRYDLNQLKMDLRDIIQKYINRELKKRPVVLAVILEVGV